MSDVVPKPPRLPSQLDEKQLGVLVHDAAYTDMTLAEVVGSDQHADGVRFNTVRLTDVNLCGSRLQELKLTDGELTRCNFANVRGTGAQATRVAIEGSRLTGISFREASLCDVAIRDCRVDLASFDFAELVSVTFEG